MNPPWRKGRGLLRLVAALLLPTLSACGPQDPLQLERGDELYDYYCLECHRQSTAGARLEGIPPGVQGPQAHELVLMIRHGHALDHPPVHLPQLTSEQADAIAAYIETLRHQDPP